MNKIEYPYYKYSPESVNESHKYEVYWDRSIITDETLLNNK